MILEKYFSNGIDEMEGHWIIPHKKIFAQMMGLKGENIKDKKKAQEDFVVLIIKLFSQEILYYEGIDKFNFSEAYHVYKEKVIG